jgi:hypothetical protein
MMKRREFLSRCAGAALAAPFALGAIAACGDDGDGTNPVDAGAGAPDGNGGGTPDARRPDAMPAAVDCEANGTNVIIGTNHGHAMTVSKADVTAGVDKLYDLQGVSPHPHTVTITAADFTMLQANTMIIKTSSNDAGHTHSITVRCLPA